MILRIEAQFFGLFNKGVDKVLQRLIDHGSHQRIDIHLGCDLDPGITRFFLPDLNPEQEIKPGLLIAADLDQFIGIFFNDFKSRITDAIHGKPAGIPGGFKILNPVLRDESPEIIEVGDIGKYFLSRLFDGPYFTFDF